MNRLLCGLLTWGLLVGVTGPVKGQYNFTTLDVPGAEDTYAIGIDTSGQIVGQYLVAGRFHGFLLDVDGSYTTLDVPGADATRAFGINDNGQIVGLYSAGGRIHGFLATPN